MVIGTDILSGASSTYLGKVKNIIYKSKKELVVIIINNNLICLKMSKVFNN